MHGNKTLALQRGYAITSHCLRPYCTAKLRYFIDTRKSIYRFLFFLHFLWFFCDKCSFCIKTKLYVYGFVGLRRGGKAYLFGGFANAQQRHTLPRKIGILAQISQRILLAIMPRHHTQTSRSAIHGIVLAVEGEGGHSGRE